MTDERLVLPCVYQCKTPDRESHKVSVGRDSDRLGVLETVCVDDSIVEPPSYVSSLNGWFCFLNSEVENDSGVDSSSCMVPEYNRSSICSTHAHSLHFLSHVKQM